MSELFHLKIGREAFARRIIPLFGVDLHPHYFTE